MNPPVIIERNGVTCELHCGDCLEIAQTIGVVDAVITDPPFSERTHSGHDSSANGHIGDGNDGASRKVLGYQPWGLDEIHAFCRLFNPDGWMVVLTDHVLAPMFACEMKAWGRYVFAPLPSFTPGRSVRLSGDGPSSWTDWIVVSRTANQSRWGTLAGGYINRGSSEHMGGKPLGLMCRLVEDYTRQGNLVCDPCCGSGTTGIACLRTGRNFIGIEKDPKHFATAVERIQREANQGVLI